MKSLGYNQVQIALAYSFYPLIPIIVGVIFGWVIGLVLQIPIIGVFNNFFTLPSQFNAYYPSLFYSLLGFLVLCSLVCFFISLRMISINTLDLINFNKNLRPNSLILKLRANLPLKRFNTKFKFSIAAVSVKKIVMIFGTMLIATFAITMAIALPVTGSSIVHDYYKYWNFKNETDYEAPIPNSPITRYDVYQWQGVGQGNSIDYPLTNNGVIPKYYHSIGNPTWRETSKINTNEYDPTIDKGGNYPSELINMLGYNLLAFRGANISIGSLQKILDDYRDPTTGKPDDQIQFMVDNVACTVLPKIAGINHSLVGDWKSCIQQTVSALAPAYLMEYWNKSVERQNEFTIAAQTVPYDQANDEFFTKFTSTVQLNNQAVGIATYGINPNSRMITFNKDLLQQDKYQNNTIPILINQAFEKRYNYHVNDIISAQPNVDILTYTNTLGQAVPIDPTWWVYNDTLDNDQGLDSYDPSKDIPLDQIDFSHLSYGNSDLVKYNGVTNPSRYTALEYGYYDPTYLDSSGNHVRPYYLMKNILLKLPATGVNGIDLNKVIVNDKNPSGNPFPSLIDGKYGVVRTRDNSYVIRPFDWNYSVIAITSVQQVFGDAGIPTQWYTEAFKTGLLKIANANDLASNPYQKKVNYQVVGVQNSYEKPLIYLNQNIANQLLGYATTYHQDLGIPTYFNGKFTLNSEPTDQTTRLGLASITGGYDINNFNDNFNWMVKDNNMISTKIDILDRVALIALMLGIAFILIIIFAAIAIVTMITNLFVNQFSKMMALLRIQGYTNREINSFTLGLFTPIVVIALILGFIAGWFAIVGGINIFENAHLLVLPYSFTWYLIIIVLCTIAIIYLVTYLLSAHSLRKMHIQEQVALLDE
nr:ABC transporter permease [Spiroplasma eriocheiris]